MPRNRHPSWQVRGQVFADQHGHFENGRPAASLKAPDGAQAWIHGSGSEVLFTRPYGGPVEWIGVYLDVPLDWDEVGALVRTSYRLSAPSSLYAQVERAEERERRGRR